MALLARFQRTITTNAGIIVPGASVEVRRENDNGLPALFADRDGLVPMLNPFAADAQGFAAFHVIGGVYKITATSGAFSRTWRYVGIGTTSEFDVEQLSLAFANFPDLDEAQVVGRPAGAGTGDPGRLTATQIRTILNTVGTWLGGPGRSAGITTSPQNILATDSGKIYVNFNADRQANLPVPANGLIYGFVTNTGILNLNAANGGFILFADGSGPTSVILADRQCLFLHCDGANWLVFGSSFNNRLATINVAGDVRFASAADYRANVAGRGLAVDEVWSSAGVAGLTDAATIGVDFSAGYNFSVTLGGNRTLGNPNNVKTGQAGAIVINQDGTGGRTLAYGNNWEFVGGVPPTLSTPANTKDVLFYFAQSPTSIIGTGLAKAVV